MGGSRTRIFIGILDHFATCRTVGHKKCVGKGGPYLFSTLLLFECWPNASGSRVILVSLVFHAFPESFSLPKEEINTINKFTKFAQFPQL